MPSIYHTAKRNLPQIIVTGASGFLGRNFINHVKEHFRIIAIADVSHAESGISKHSNIFWITKNISTIDCIEDFAAEIINGDTIECLAHLAINSNSSDFSKNKSKSLYSGTQNMLELARLINIKHFLFISSLEVYKYSNDSSRVINESTRPDSINQFSFEFLKHEELVKKHSKYFKCSILRNASVYSDCCENPELFRFLNNRLSGNFSSSLIAGKGISAETYIHIDDLSILINRIICNEKKLSNENYFIAGTPGAVSQIELIEVLDMHNNNQAKQIHISKTISKSIATFKKLLHLKINSTWSVRSDKIDKRIEIDNRLTRQLLQWKPTRRYDLLRRLPVLIDNRKQKPEEWLLKNYASCCKTIYKNTSHPKSNFEFSKDVLLKKITEIVQNPFNSPRFTYLQTLNTSQLTTELKKIIEAFQHSVALTDNSYIYDYSEKAARMLFTNNYEIKEYRHLMNTLSSLLSESEIYTDSTQIPDYRKQKELTHLLQLCADKADDFFEQLQTEEILNSQTLPELKRIKSNEFTALRNHLKNQTFPAELKHNSNSKIFMN